MARWGAARRKIREIAASDLIMADKLRYAASLLTRDHPREYRLRGGISIELRPDTTDGRVFEEAFLSGVYAPLAAMGKRLTGDGPVVLIDLGANIGLSAVYLARILRPDWIVAVEPDASNYALLLRNLRLAGLVERCSLLQAFAGAARGFAELEDSGNGAWGLRKGRSSASGIPVIPLLEIIGRADATGPGASRVILKCDIEGAERELFLHMHEWEDRVDYIILELHMEFLTERELHSCIEGSSYHWRIHGDISRESVLAVIGLERLARKPTRPDFLAARVGEQL